MKRAVGFSVLELLIALGLGLLVVAGVVQLFVGNSRTYEVVNAQARLQENARFAFDFITEAARSAGYFGCAPDDDNIARQVNGPWNIIPEFDMTVPVRGWEAVGDGTWTPDDLIFLPRSTGGVDTFVHQAGNGIDRDELEEAPESDVIVFRSAEQPLARLNATLQPDGDPVVSTPGGVPSFNVGDIVFVADCEQAALFNVTAVAVGGGGDTATLSHAVGAADPFDNGVDITTASGDIIPATLSVVGRSYGRESKVARVVSTFFFIAPSTQADNQGDDVNALWQKAGINAPVELVQGIEQMDVLYGIDTTAGDGPNVNRYVTANLVGANDIVAVRVTLRVSSVDTLAENDGERLERTFTKTIQLRNMGV
ncbi:MAG: PilW family protein [Pseudomonadales bacterium]